MTERNGETLRNGEMLRTKVVYMDLYALYKQNAEQMKLTGHIRVDWDAGSEQLQASVRVASLPKTMIEHSSGNLMLLDGKIVGARIGKDGPTDMNQSLDSLLQICFGIGCDILASTELTLVSRNDTKTKIVGSINSTDLLNRVSDLEQAVYNFPVWLKPGGRFGAVVGINIHNGVPLGNALCG